MIKILVTGANGQLGQELKDLSTDFDSMEFDFRDRASLDITDPEKVISQLNDGKYNYCINCAAYTQVDKAEVDEKNCFEINAFAPMLLAHLCKDIGTRLIHISSDYVYNFVKTTPLEETDICQPEGIYAQSKLEGEEHIQESSDHHIIIRTSWLYSRHGHNFVNTMLKLGKTKDSLSIVNDQIGSPTYAKDLARAILTMIIKIGETNDNLLYGGIYNFSNEGQTNWYEFAKEIFDISNIDIKLLPIPSIDYPTPAPRPTWSVMDNTKIEKTFGIERRNWKVAIRDMLKKT